MGVGEREREGGRDFAPAECEKVYICVVDGRSNSTQLKAVSLQSLCLVVAKHCRSNALSLEGGMVTES